MKSSVPTHHRTYAAIDTSALRSNLRILQKAVGPGRVVILVVKSDAYGHGAGTVAAIAAEEGISHFAVASVDEGIQLRRADVTGEILLLHPPSEFDFPAVSEWKLTPSISSEEDARLYSHLAGSRTLSIHIELNTGLSRLGLDWRTATESIGRIAALPKLKISGIYTHYRAHYSPVGDAIQEQSERFKHVLDGLQKLGIDPGLRHAASSYPAAYHHRTTLFDGIRVGIIAYGALEPLPQPVTGILPVMSVRSCVMLIRPVNAGEWVHYGDGFQAKRDMTIAVIPVGYGMGYTRHLSNSGEMIINGQRCPIVGVVGMDMTMLDVSALPGLKVGDPVTVLGRDGKDEITALDIAKKTGTIAYEIICRLGNGLPRYVVKSETEPKSSEPVSTTK
jgi:alanine racemase